MGVTAAITTLENQHHYARLTSGCTIASQSGSWISGSTLQSGANCQLTFANGTFTSTPTCVATAEQPTSPTFCMFAASGRFTTSGVTVYCSAFNGSSANTSFDLVCSGN